MNVFLTFMTMDQMLLAYPAFTHAKHAWMEVLVIPAKTQQIEFLFLIAIANPVIMKQDQFVLVIVLKNKFQNYIN